MAVNPYFQHYNANNEQNLISNLVTESIKMKGLDVYYIQRSQENIDFLYNEDPTNKFTQSDVIEMYPAFVEGFDGEQLMSIFGDEFKKSATFIVSKERFKESFYEIDHPREGDLIFMPVTNTLLEIKFVQFESPFFEKGKQYVYELKLEAFEYSYEEVETDDYDVNDILSNLEIDGPLEQTTEEYGDNEEIDVDSGEDIQFDKNNPFGVR